ncbi:hypothetical protein K2173_003124 [Erythroxylum novogranatense]|uniref:Uncharacterized protein n=1 Tax=Erythroxylum novogranatense TaxID=1862640 RepID=A0AAV8TAD8_9ROSI|nr:hypothetical protein K2173_003124 [Erythroxylum novogranatense]
MGNCLRRESPTLWGGDEWGSPVVDLELFGTNRRQDDEVQDKGMKMEEDGLLGDHKRGIISSSTKPGTELKIKLTKKQLEKLLGSVDMKELSVEQVLTQLASISDEYEAHQTSWRPNLQSIPE